MGWVLPIIIIVLLVLTSSVKVVREYERLVVFRLGHVIGARGPGLVIIIPFIDRTIKIPLRIVTLDVPTQEVITRDNVTTSVNAVVYYRVLDPTRAVINVEEYRYATAQLAQTTLRSVVGQADLDELLSERDKLNMLIQQILDQATDPWGIKVSAVEIKDVVIAESLQKAISRQATAERERRAIIVQAEGEKEAAEKLAEAAQILSGQDGALYLRLLRTLPEIASQQGSLIAFPMPMELRHLFPQATDKK
ncbi:MAG TPA: slipin family protein [Firmicutes bacterium]|nr:slipin family protein [Bacillota bacterium]